MKRTFAITTFLLMMLSSTQVNAMVPEAYNFYKNALKLEKSNY